jgi:hypothetical protein
MTKMNWDRVRAEDRDLRRGSEWVSSESYSLPFSAPTERSLNVSAANGAKRKKKKKKKHKLAQQSIQVRANGSVTVKPRLPATLSEWSHPSGEGRPAQPLHRSELVFLSSCLYIYTCNRLVTKSVPEPIKRERQQ